MRLPIYRKLAAASTFGVLATARSSRVDFVSRCFFPAYLKGEITV